MSDIKAAVHIRYCNRQDACDKNPVQPHTHTSFYSFKKGAKKAYAWNDEERMALMEEYGDGSKIQRYKGLGEMNAIQLWDTTMNPEFRTLRQIQVDNGVEADRVFSMLMGDEVPPRREFIEKNAIYANIDA